MFILLILSMLIPIILAAIAFNDAIDFFIAIIIVAIEAITVSLIFVHFFQ